MPEAPEVSASTSSHPQQGARGRGSGSHRRGRPRRGGQRNGQSNEESSQAARVNEASAGGHSTTRISGETPSTRGSTPASTPASTQSSAPRGRGRRGGAGRGRGGAAVQTSTLVSRRAFGGHLTSQTDASAGVDASHAAGLSGDAPEFVPGQQFVPSSSRTSAPKQKPAKTTPKVLPKSSAADLPTRIHEDIDNGQYECVICTSEVVRTSQIWSCSICWTVAHRHCVRKWHTNQARNPDQNAEPTQVPTWRCPGCNSSLTEEPGPYHCWCGKEMSPKPIAGLSPHSCGQTCSKPRGTCPHPCSLTCHAGPCPPCTLMGPTQSCYCGKHSSTKRCSETEYGKGWSCEEICGDYLPCGEHTCSRPCHSGLCGACEIPVLSNCYCGKEEREIECDQRDDILESFNYGQLKSSVAEEDKEGDNWFEGAFRCQSTCGRAFDCEKHACQKPCHPQDEDPAHCPFSPDVITHCPCGKTPLGQILAEPRQSCEDPVPHCEQPCDKQLPCGHLCQDPCHTGPCSFCSQTIDMACRCGRTSLRSACHQGTVEAPLCFRICKAQLNCGRHECGEHCCSGEKKAMERRRQKKTANENFEAEHICLQVCGRQLRCGQHTCQQLCHRGPCPSCLEAVFDEISCSCGRTVLQPPQPCGTRSPECRFDCTRPQPCGHPTVSHQCHPDDTPCAKCPYLVEKSCICGKKNMKNQPCWFEEVRCGLPCGKKLKCGIHECKKLCHRAGECEDASISGSHCSQSCGKTRKSCDHACTDQCHAPYPCKEDKPCQSKTFITCPCQNRKQEIRCLSTRMSPFASKHEPLKCDDECLRLQRNRKLAEALHIDPETHTDDHVPYSETTLKLFKDAHSTGWAQTQEREFRVFAGDSDEKRLRFKPMSSQQRAFLHALAEDYGLDSESMDPEPHRHVCVFKTPRFVSAPRKTLAQCVRIIKNTPAPAPASRPADQSQAFNAILIKDARFGLTIDELDEALKPDLGARPGPTTPAVKFTISFLPNEEVIIKASPSVSAASIASSLAPTPAAVETYLAGLKPTIGKTISRLGLAGAASLCHADDSLNVTRREGDGGASTGGWSSVASRGAWRRNAAPTPAAQQKAPSAFVALKKKKEEIKKVLAEPVEDDWLAAAEKLDDEGTEEGEEGIPPDAAITDHPPEDLEAEPSAAIEAQ